VARAHGNRGEIIVNLESDFPNDRFAVGRVLKVGSHEQLRRIESVRFQQGRPVIALEGISTMNDAEALAGAELEVAAADIAPLPDQTFYRHDLVGCEVQARSGEQLGRVAAVDGPMERSHLVVDGQRGEILIPLAAEICISIDLERRMIIVDPPDGLIELN
jgi:16S rRNA processing protein RimM